MSEPAQDDKPQIDGVPEGIDLAQFTKELIGDLRGLRSGRISIPQARASAELARQIIRSMHLVVSAQKLIEERAKPLNGETSDS